MVLMAGLELPLRAIRSSVPLRSTSSCISTVSTTLRPRYAIAECSGWKRT